MPATAAPDNMPASATKALIVSTIFFIAAITLVVSPEARAISLLRSPTATRFATSPTSLGSAPSCRPTILAIIRPKPIASSAPRMARTDTTMEAFFANIVLPSEVALACFSFDSSSLSNISCSWLAAFLPSLFRIRIASASLSAIASGNTRSIICPYASRLFLNSSNSLRPSSVRMLFSNVTARSLFSARIFLMVSNAACFSAKLFVSTISRRLMRIL